MTPKTFYDFISENLNGKAYKSTTGNFMVFVTTVLCSNLAIGRDVFATSFLLLSFPLCSGYLILLLSGYYF